MPDQRKRKNTTRNFLPVGPGMSIPPLPPTQRCDPKRGDRRVYPSRHSLDTSRPGDSAGSSRPLGLESRT